MSKKSYIPHSVILSSIVIALAGINLLSLTNKKQIVNITVSTKSDIEYWRQMIVDYPTYKDAYLILASLEMSHGNVMASDKLVERARELDPNGDVILPEVQ